MKKLFTWFSNMETINQTMLVTLFWMGLFVVMIIFSNQPQKYPTCGVVSEVSSTSDLVTVEDFNGNLWSFTEVGDWSIGDICAMIMSDNGTPEDVYDDEILQVRYCGHPTA